MKDLLFVNIVMEKITLQKGIDYYDFYSQNPRRKCANCGAIGPNYQKFMFYGQLDSVDIMWNKRSKWLKRLFNI